MSLNDSHRRRCLLALSGAVLLSACGEQAISATQSGPVLWTADPSAQLLSGAGALPLDTLRGKALLVFFGYVRCPDVCPTMNPKGELVKLIAYGTQADDMRQDLRRVL